MLSDAQTDALLMASPFMLDWCTFKGETVVAQVNWPATRKNGRLYMDISYCMTEALNGNVLCTAPFSKQTFRPGKLSDIKHWLF